MAALAPVPWKVLLTASELAQVFLVSTTLAFVQSYSGSIKGEPVTAQPVAYGWGLVGAYAFVYLGEALSTGQYWYASSQLMTKIRGAYVEAIYRKGLNLHLMTARTSGGGKAANLMSVDAERVVKAVDTVHSLWSGAIVIAIGVYLLYAQLGFVFFASVITVIVCLVLTPYTSRGLGTKQAAWSASTDKRVNLTSSVTSDIKGVKFSAYEEILHEKICKVRAEELTNRSSLMMQMTGVVTFTNCTSEMFSVATFLTLFVVDKLSGSNRFNLNTIITTLTIFAILQNPLSKIGQEYSYLVQAWASMKRIEDFLGSEDRPDIQDAVADGIAAQAAAASSDVGSVNFAARLENAALGWGDEVVLSDVTLEVPRGSLTMICGRLGQGKSTLLQAILGESDLIRGKQYLPLLADRVAYVSQDVWLQEKRSIRENVIFATGEYDEDRYTTALKACALDEDIDGLQEGDATTAGALSGGQRQRLAVARAVYSDAESYIFDDITSALDAETAAHMWRSLMGPAGLLQGKTVIMATNAIHLLHHAQLIIRIDAGKIAEQGRYEEISMKGKDAISRASVDSQRAMPVLKESADKAIKTGAAEKQEGVMTGSVGFGVYAGWFKAAGLVWVALFSAAGILSTGGYIGSTYVLQAWAEAQQRHRFEHWGAWMAGYIALLPVNGIMIAGGFILMYVYCAETAGTKLHEAELRVSCSLRSPSLTSGARSDHQPLLSGPLQCRSDICTGIHESGVLLHRILWQPYHHDCSSTLPCVAGSGHPGLIVGHAATLHPVESSAPSARDGSQEPALLSLFGNFSPSGLATVRGLKRQASLIELNTQALDVSSIPYFHLFAVRRWLQTWLLLSTTLINVILVLLVVVLRHSSNAGVFGVALVNATSLGIMLNQTVISMTEVEIAGVALERVREFSEIKPEEDVVASHQQDGKPSDEDTFRHCVATSSLTRSLSRTDLISSLR